MPREWEDYIKDEERKLMPSNDEMLSELDAYGHLNWTVGNEDWLACFDAVRHDDRIAYHVVVDCESGGFTDTLEKGVIPVTDIDQLRGLPDTWVSTCMEHYAGQKGHGRIQWKRTEKNWNKHLDQLLKQETER